MTVMGTNAVSCYARAAPVMIPAAKARGLLGVPFCLCIRVDTCQVAMCDMLQVPIVIVLIWV